MIVASNYNIIYVDLQNGKEVDLDKINGVSHFKAVIYDEIEKGFYIMTNILNDQMGFYLFHVDVKKPEENNFLITWKNNNEIDDVSICINRDQKMGMRELIVSYK